MEKIFSYYGFPGGKFFSYWISRVDTAAVEIHGGKKRETGAGKNLSEGAKNKKNAGPVSGYFKAGKTFFRGIRLGTEEPRQFEGVFKPFGGFRRPLLSFFTVF